MQNNNIIPIHQIGFPISFENIIPDDDSVRVLYKVMEGLDFTELKSTYSTIGRNSAVLPETMFTILVYGYMEGIYSSRALEKACKRDINFKWLLQGQQPPGHNSIARFRSKRLKGCIENLFNQFIKKLGELKEIEFDNIFIDGTKIEASANRYTFVWKKSIAKNEANLQNKIKEIFLKINQNLHFCFIIDNSIISVDDATSLKDILYSIVDNSKLEFVHGKGRRKSKLQKYIEELDKFIEKQSYYNNCNDIFNGRNSFSKTDHDATFMHMKEDHMKNGQLKPAYNIQIGVEGYESEENYMHLESNNQEAYIKPATYEKSKTKKFKSDISKRENMIFNVEDNYYICSAGKRLFYKGEQKKKSASGYESSKSIYECEDCSKCEYKSRCTRAKGNKQLHVARNFIRLREKSLENITSEKGIILRMKRSIQVEGAFGVIKQDYGFRRFLMRGMPKVRTEFLLMAFGYNVNKLHSKTLQKRNGKLLHKQQAS